MIKDPYSILGVSKDAKQNDIKKAYRDLAKKLHPDLNPGNKDAETKFKDVGAAYELIGDEEKRKKFDQGKIDEDMYKGSAGFGKGPFYHETQTGPGGKYRFNFRSSKGGSPFDSSGSADDLFSELFGSARGFKPPPEDHHYRMDVSFKDAVLGAETEFMLPTGKKIRVTIPAGIESGTKLRLAGQGAKGDADNKGDAYVQINVRSSKVFDRRGKDLEVEVPISLYEAVLGREIKVPTLQGAILLKIPKNTSSGNRLRVKGKGVKNTKSNESGDFYVRFKVIMPENQDPKLEKLIHELAEGDKSDPRSELFSEISKEAVS